MPKDVLIVDGIALSLLKTKLANYICISDIAYKSGIDAASVIHNWIRANSTLEFLCLWEEMHNPYFNVVTAATIANEKSKEGIQLPPTKWINETGAIGIIVELGGHKKVFAHPDIALNFAYYVSPRFQLYVLKEFQRLREEEAKREAKEWDVHRIMSKANHRIYTEAIREHLIPPRIRNTRQEGMIYASEADRLNVALFGTTAKQWRLENPEAKGNIRDNATAEQLLVLANLQSLNAKLMEWGSDEKQRLEILNATAIEQMRLIIGNNSLKKLDQKMRLESEENQRKLLE